MAEPKRSFVERLFAEHHRALHAYFYRRIRGKSHTADLVQEVYVRMLRVSDVDAIRNPDLYLYTVASNLAKEHAVLERRQLGAVDADDSGIQDLLGELPTVDRELDSDRRAARLRGVLMQLSPKCRAAVALRYRHELSYEEIGARLGVSPNMVKKYLVQALAHCRRRMASME
jgi:RNA polymerase sigma factor (sigma-70 family)